MLFLKLESIFDSDRNIKSSKLLNSFKNFESVGPIIIFTPSL